MREYFSAKKLSVKALVLKGASYDSYDVVYNSFSRFIPCVAPHKKNKVFFLANDAFFASLTVKG